MIINTQTFTQSILILRTIMQGIVKVENNVFKTFIVKDNVEKLHSFANQPAIVHVDGSKKYYKDGMPTSLDVLEQENNQSIDITRLSADKQQRVMEFIQFIERYHTENLV